MFILTDSDLLFYRPLLYHELSNLILLTIFNMPQRLRRNGIYEIHINIATNYLKYYKIRFIIQGSV